MGFPDTIERTLELTRPPADVWQALTTVEGLTSWFSERATIDLRAGGELRLSWPDHEPVMRIEQVDEPNVFAFTWPVDGNTTDALPRTYVEFRLVPNGSGTTLTVTESGFAQLPEGTYEKTYDAHSGGWTSELGELAEPPRGLTVVDHDIEAVAEQVFVALADPTRRSILAALASGGPATATDLADRLPITRQGIAKHLALLSDAGLVIAEPGERRRVRYRLDSAPMQLARQFLTAMSRDWDSQLDALKRHLDG